jgi:hypothetical protein
LYEGQKYLFRISAENSVGCLILLLANTLRPEVPMILQDPLGLPISQPTHPPVPPSNGLPQKTLEAALSPATTLKSGNKVWIGLGSITIPA